MNDARTRTAFTGDTNPIDPEIVLDGSNLTVPGPRVDSGGNRVFVLIVQPLSPSGIKINGGGNCRMSGYLREGTGESRLCSHSR